MSKKIAALQAVLAGVVCMALVLAAGQHVHAQIMTWNTFMGSAEPDFEGVLAVDGSGNVYVAGFSDATWGSPVNAHAGDFDVFIAKFSTDGDLLWNTFLGSAGYDNSASIAVDGSGNVYVAGLSNATWGSPVNAHTGEKDVFIAKCNADGDLVWNTFLGSTGNDNSGSIAVDGSGNVYVAGESDATWGSPVNAHAGGMDGFAAKLNAGGDLVWNTFLGSAGYDYGYGVAVDGSGNVYVAGYGDATWGSPVNAHAGGSDGFAAKLNAGGALLWNTFQGSTDTDVGTSIAVDGSGNVYVSGTSAATWGSPINAHAGGYDGFAAMLNAGGALQWNTFLGSTGYDNSGSIVVDGSGNAYVAGQSAATWGSPVNAHAGGYDGFAAMLNAGGDLLWNTFLGSSGWDSCYAIAVDGSGNVYVAGQSNVTWGNPVNAHAGGYDGFAAKLLYNAEFCLDDEDCPEGVCLNNVCVQEGEAKIYTCKVKAGENGKGDSMQFSGTLDVTEGELNAASEAVVTVETAAIPGLAVFRFEIGAEDVKKGKYKSPKVTPADKSDPQSALQIDSNKGTIKFNGKNLDLTGFACPITIIIEIGTYMAEQELDADIVNGKKECPVL